MLNTFLYIIIIMTVFIIIFIYFNKRALFVSSPATIALAIQMSSFCHANKCQLNWMDGWMAGWMDGWIKHIFLERQTTISDRNTNDR